MTAYDLDGVLAAKPKASAKKWGLMSGVERESRRNELLHHYVICEPLYSPPEGERFMVITARKREERIVHSTEMWLNYYFPGRIAGVHFLSDSRTLDNVAKFKSGKLLEFGISDFVEDNKQVLKRLAKACPGVRLWFWDCSMRGLEPERFQS